jgi:hypothetical protein
MSVMTSRGLPPIGSLDQHQQQQHHQEEHDFDAYGYPGDDSIAAAQAAAANITESSFVRRAIAGNVVTLQQAQDLLSLMQSNAGDNDVPPGLVQEREQRYEQTVEKLAVAMSLEQAGSVGAVFFLDDGRSYGMLKTADRRLTLFVPPSSLYTTSVFDLDSASHLPFLPTEQCNYSIYVKASSLAEPALAGAAASMTAAQNSKKGKEELVPFPVATAAAATTTTAAAAASKPAPVAKPASAAAATKKISSALVPSDDEEDEEEDEEKPTPTKKRQAPADEQLAVPEEKEKRAKPEPKKKVTTIAAKKPGPAAATTVATTTATAAAAAAVATEHKK